MCPFTKAGHPIPDQALARYAPPDGTEGTARYYSRRYNRRKTSSGEIYSPKKLTAAHPTLPFGTLVKVVNPENNKSVIVRINDRCHEHEDSFIDLSLQAARELDIIRQGKARVRMIIVADETLPDEVQDTEQR